MALEYFSCRYFALLKQDVVPSQTKGINFSVLRKFSLRTADVFPVSRKNRMLSQANESLTV